MVALRGGGRVGGDGIDSPAVGGEAEHPTHDVVIGSGQIVVGDVDLAIGEPFLEQGVLYLNTDAARWRCEQVGNGFNAKSSQDICCMSRPSGPPTPSLKAVRNSSSVARVVTCRLTPRVRIFPNCWRCRSKSAQSDVPAESGPRCCSDQIPYFLRSCRTRLSDVTPIPLRGDVVIASGALGNRLAWIVAGSPGVGTSSA